MEDQHLDPKKSKFLFIVFALLTAITALIGVVIMTDVGQILRIEKSWVVWYYSNSMLVWVVSLVFLAVTIFLGKKNGYISNKWTVIWIVLWILCIISSKYLTPYFILKDKQNDSVYISIDEAKDYLTDDERVLVVDYNGVQRAYPPEMLWIAHIFGGDFNGEEVVFTYCVLTNLASPFPNDLNGEKVSFKVLAQTNNNLLIWDENSGEIIQQITQQCEFSKTRLEALPVMEMPWGSFKKLYPNGTVLYNVWDTPYEKFMNSLFSAEETWYGDSWMFDTANLEDKRFPHKEHIIGIRDDDLNKQLAVSKDYIRKNGICNLKVGNKAVALVYYPEYKTIRAFDRIVNGEEIELTEVDIHGVSQQYGELQPVYVFNSVLWAVWAHYYPETEVLK